MSKYGVALSFAGEQRLYVEEVARTPQSRGVSVFYDKFETVRLWGCRSGGCTLPMCSGSIPAYAGPTGRAD